MPLAKLYEIFRAQPRYTEPIERKRPLRRETDHNSKNRQNDTEKEKDLLFSEDQMDVSIQSLKAFFTGLLEQQDTRRAPPEQSKHDKTPPQTTPQAAKAVTAYHHAAETAPEPLLPEQVSRDTPAGSQESPDITILDNAEQEKIQELLGLLDKLAAQNIEKITLKPAPRFLDSVEHAIKKNLPD